MRRRYASVPALSAAVLVGLCATSAAAPAVNYAPRAGRVYPDFTLPNLADGLPTSLSQFRGRKVLLIHFASW